MTLLCGLPILTELQRLQGEWKDKSAGGSPPHSSTWLHNPQYLLKLTRRASLRISLARPDWQSSAALPEMRFFVLPTATDTPRVWIDPNEMESYLTATDSTSSFLISQRFELGSADYDTNYAIIPCLKDPGVTGHFSLKVQDISPTPTAFEFDLAPALWRAATAQGSWTADSCGGSLEFPTWMLNQQFWFAAPEAATYHISVSCEFPSLQAIGFYACFLNSGSVSSKIPSPWTRDLLDLVQMTRRGAFITLEVKLAMPISERRTIYRGQSLLRRTLRS